MCCPSGGLKLRPLPCIPDTSPCSTQLENLGDAHNIPWTGCWCKIGSSSKIFGGGEQAALGRAPASALPCHPPPVLGCSGQSGPWHLAAPQTHASARVLHRWALTQLEQQREMKNNHKIRGDTAPVQGWQQARAGGGQAMTSGAQECAAQPRTPARSHCCHGAEITQSRELPPATQLHGMPSSPAWV